MSSAVLDKLSNDAWARAVFGYRPSEAAAWAAMAVFAALSACNAFITARTRAPGTRYLYWIPFSGAMEAVGYILRVLTVQRRDRHLLIGAAVLLVLPPIPLAVINYVAVGKLMRATGVHFGRLQPQHVARLFLASDVICLVVQGQGATMLTGTGFGSAAAGKAVILAGLVLQLGFFSAFVVLALALQRSAAARLARVPALRRVFGVLYATVTLLYTRNVSRAVEFAQMTDRAAYTTTHEWLFYVFNAIAIAAVVALYTVWHFAALLPSDDALSAAMAGEAPPTPQEGADGYLMPTKQADENA